ncbi:hypothetical protein E0504_41510 [Parafrankia sp. BMG5.11]|nr:hypothetical protein E0504_41510 [Parafrankia sp. BMG5.11]
MSGHDELYIDGRWTSPAGSELFEVVSAATEEIIGTVPAGRPRNGARRRRHHEPSRWRSGGKPLQLPGQAGRRHRRCLRYRRRSARASR